MTLVRSDTSLHVEDKLRNSKLFGQYFSECMTTDKTLRGNCWNHDVLISNCNLLIEKFLKTQSRSLVTYFRTFVVISDNHSRQRAAV
jgi:hypothetical protein